MPKTVLLISIIFGWWLRPGLASAHCPLCTAGAGILAVASSWLGISTAAVGVFIGAFALALGLWLAQMIKHHYFPWQNQIIAAIIAVLTIGPIMPLIREYRPLYIALGGEYGTWWHNTYALNLFLTGAVIGAGVLIISPGLSRLITKFRGGAKWSYQSLSLTIGLLLITGLILQFSL